MGLRQALERLPHDRAVESAARTLLSLFRANPGKWLAREDVLEHVSDPVAGRKVLEALSEAFVLDFQDAPPRYRYEPGPLLEMETERYLHGAERHDERRRSNMARFRRRFGDG